MKKIIATFVNQVGFGRGGFDIAESDSEPVFRDWCEERDREEWRGRSILASLPDPGGEGQKLTAENSNDIIGPQSVTGYGNKK